MKVRCLIIDDEPPARELLASYLLRLEDFEIVKQFGNAVEAFAYLQTNTVDLMFLDVQMPNMSGMELIKTLSRPPHVILTTAFREYAIEGFELSVLDYLVKPVSFERFMKAIGRYHQLARHSSVAATTSTLDQAYIFIKVNKEQIKVFLKDILYIESIKDYLKVITENNTYIIHHGLTSMEEKLPSEHFFRIHKSFIVSLHKIMSYRNESVKVGSRELPLGRVYKKQFLDVFQKAEEPGVK